MNLFFLKNLFAGVVKWMEAHPVTSAGLFTLIGTILGAILSTILNINNRTPSFTNRIKKIIKQSRVLKSFKINVLNNWFQSNTVERPSVDVRQELLKAEPKSALTPQQITLCQQVEEVTKTHLTQAFDPRPSFEEAVREKNTNGAGVAALKYSQVFNKIATTLQQLANDRGIDTEINNLLTVTERLTQMLGEPSDDEALKRQFNICENALLMLMAKLHEPT